MYPSHLLYKAWKNTPKIIHNTKDAKGNELVREIEFQDPMKTNDMEETNGNCFLCGDPMTQGIKIKKAFSSVFTDWNQANNPQGTHICSACAFSVLTNKKARIGVRMFSLIAADKLYITNRKELREWLLDPPEPPFLAMCAVSQKKHLIMKAIVNYSRDIFSVQYEETPVTVDRVKFTNLLNLIEHFLYGFTKTEILTGQYSQKRILDFGIEEWEAFENRIKPYRGTGLLDVVMFVAQKLEEWEEIACFMDSELKIKRQVQPHYSSTPSIEAGIKKEDRVASTCGDKSNDSPKSQQSEQLQLELF
ncbi:hypothetical protein GCM10011391_28220 [Pullulanibacillus camelliae]|uniref:Uncharacterized protein n=1 Tax=Pullulanibacillus camelliae TaxID=1707096 RepID=A0A8J2YJU2_9BACL|nr:hypothetical protein [Pullulanibacillus camelliae]GGE47816.1 hypothetical protein GCM10011391_28220 [Pullulanibacillus camelliae]